MGRIKSRSLGGKREVDNKKVRRNKILKHAVIGEDWGREWQLDDIGEQTK